MSFFLSLCPKQNHNSLKCPHLDQITLHVCLLSTRIFISLLALSVLRSVHTILGTWCIRPLLLQQPWVPRPDAGNWVIMALPHVQGYCSLDNLNRKQVWISASKLNCARKGHISLLFLSYPKLDWALVFLASRKSSLHRLCPPPLPSSWALKYDITQSVINH